MIRIGEYQIVFIGILKDEKLDANKVREFVKLFLTSEAAIDLAARLIEAIKAETEKKIKEEEEVASSEKMKSELPTIFGMKF